MKMHRSLRILKFVLFGIAFAAILTYVVMRLWNWLTPALFGWHMIGFWQALGILFLCKILFGGFRGGHGGHLRWRRRMMERWEQMTPEEREKFRESMRGCWGPFSAPAEKFKA
jgi:hypothetical protein